MPFTLIYKYNTLGRDSDKFVILRNTHKHKPRDVQINTSRRSFNIGRNIAVISAYKNARNSLKSLQIETNKNNTTNRPGRYEEIIKSFGILEISKKPEAVFGFEMSDLKKSTQFNAWLYNFDVILSETCALFHYIYMSELT